MLVAQNGSIVVKTQTTFNPVFMAYLSDLLGTKPGNSLIDPVKLKERLGQEKGISLLSLDHSKPSSFELQVNIANPNQVLSNHKPQVRKLSSLSTQSGVRTLSFTFNRDIIEALAGIVASEGGDQLAYLLPQKQGISAKDYQVSLDWAMEEYGSKQERQAMFSLALVTLNVQVPSAVISATGFTIVDQARGRLQLKLSLLDLMTNRSDKVYAVRY